MIDLIEELLERMERYAQQTEKSRTSRDASLYMGHVEECNDDIRTILEDRYIARAGRAYFRARTAYMRTLEENVGREEKMNKILNNQKHTTDIIEEMDRELRRRMTPEFVDDLERTVMQRVQEKEKHDV